MCKAEKKLRRKMGVYDIEPRLHPDVVSRLLKECQDGECSEEADAESVGKRTGTWLHFFVREKGHVILKFGTEDTENYAVLGRVASDGQLQFAFTWGDWADYMRNDVRNPHRIEFIANRLEDDDWEDFTEDLLTQISSGEELSFPMTAIAG